VTSSTRTLPKAHATLRSRLEADAGPLEGSKGAGNKKSNGVVAGTRAILVTNWPVHSAFARALVTDLFRRQATDAKLSHGEARRQARTALIDGPGYQDEQGNTLFSYAHPLFWAPYTIIGDGG
jgi:CHAT domain-containing protein